MPRLSGLCNLDVCVCKATGKFKLLKSTKSVYASVALFTTLKQERLSVGCVPPACAGHTCFNSHQMSLPVGFLYSEVPSRGLGVGHSKVGLRVLEGACTVRSKCSREKVASNLFQSNFLILYSTLLGWISELNFCRKLPKKKGKIEHYILFKNVSLFCHAVLDY